MPKLRVHCFSLSLDGYAAGPEQSRQRPLGRGGSALHEWMFATRTGRRLFGAEGGETGLDDDFTARGFDNIGAWIIGRTMFGPVRGPWPDESWRGWWGDNPPYHTDVFVLTHHARRALPMEGGTTFYFVNDGIESALEQAMSSARGRDVRLGGGVDTLRQYLRARLVDEMHFVISSGILGSGEAPFHGIDLLQLGYRCGQYVTSARATHVVLEKS